MTERTAAIFGCAGEILTGYETSFFRDVCPVGLILFARNCQSPDQVRHLIGSWREAVAADDVLVLIDQEGGRVCRLGPPHWRKPPAAAEFGCLARLDLPLGREATRLNGQVIGAELHDLGINVDCAPVLDVPMAGAHDVIGDRAFASDPRIVVELGKAMCEGLIAAGVLPVIKHIPGHGRAAANSHEALPVVDAARTELEVLDFVPFRLLAATSLAMTAHVVFEALDGARAATISPHVIELIRAHIGFDGLLMTDDVSMKALSGGVGESAKAARTAGCDVVLHCTGDVDEMTAVADHAGLLDADGRHRLDRALGMLRPPEVFDAAVAIARIESLLDGAGESERT